MKKDVGLGLNVTRNWPGRNENDVGLGLTLTLKRPWPNEEKIWAWA